MYEQFGAFVDDDTKKVTFKLFIPDGIKAPHQYLGGGLPRIKQAYVVGSFQTASREWDINNPVPMKVSDFHYPEEGLVQGSLYSYTTPPLQDGFYEYKYRLEFYDAEDRYITDPCGRYGGETHQNSGIVIGGEDEEVKPLAARLPLKDLIIYEMMIDDFVHLVPERDASEAPLQTVVRKLDYLKGLGINAIEFMPWTAWTYPDDPTKEDFSWGYNPVQYFSAAHKYTLNQSNELNKLVYLKRLINECHRRNIHVIMDGVFNHADAAPPDLGFPYYWLYDDPADSPYVGNFADAAFFRDLDYANQCTMEYIRDACIYWIETFKIDGIRLDNTLGMFRPGDRSCGLPKLLSELRYYLAKKRQANFSFILEHAWDYSSIDVTNKVGATSCWLDKYRSLCMDYLGNRPNGIPQIETPIMRMLDSGRDFDEYRGRTPVIYIENHDHRRFMLKAGGRDHWYLTQPYIIALFTCAGAPMIYNGQEFGQQNNMPEDDRFTVEKRVIPRPVIWDMENTGSGPAIKERYKQMMKIRDQHPGLRNTNFYPRNWDENNTKRNPEGFGIDRDRNLVVYHRWGNDNSGNLERFYIVLNFSQNTQSVDFDVPENGSWLDLIDGKSVNATNGRLYVDIGSNWGAIFCRKF